MRWFVSAFVVLIWAGSFQLMFGQCPPGIRVSDPDQTTCSGFFYDTGCNTGNYSNSELETISLCSNGGNCLQLTFTVFDTESGFDELTIHDGNTAGAPVIGVYSGTALQGQTIQSSSGCLFLEWDSDGSVTDPGWEATISCASCPTCNDGIQNGTETGVDCGGLTCPACPCEDTIIAALPFSGIGMTTCGFGDDYSSSDACGSSYLNGDDYVFRYTPPNNMTVSIQLFNTNTWTGFFVMDGCPDGASTNCVASATSSDGNPSACSVSLTGGQDYFFVVSTFPSPQCTPFDIAIIEESGNTCGLNYSVSSITYSPEPYNSGFTLPVIDDRFVDSLLPIGFTFCFDGRPYDFMLASSNAYVLFPCADVPGGSATPDGSSPWEINAAIPNTTDAPRNGVLAPWHDIDPSVGGNIRFQTLGTAPNRRTVVTYDNIPMFSSSCNSNSSQNFSGQVKLFETSNTIEVHIGNKQVCSTWNGGAAILGLHNSSGSAAVLAAANTNYPTNWSATNTAVAFSTSCSCTVVLDNGVARFDGVREGEGAALYWRYTAPSLLQSFGVERFDAASGSWGLVDRVQADVRVADYQLFDGEAFAQGRQRALYRLELLGMDGERVYTDVVEVLFSEAGEFEVALMSRDEEALQYEVRGHNAPVEIAVVDVMGRIVHRGLIGKNASQVSVPIWKLGRGVYFVRFVSGEAVVRKEAVIW